MRVWKRGFTVEKAELAKKKKNLTGEKQLNIFFLSLSLSLFLFPTHSPSSHDSVCMST